jgi:hypothetical protein
MPAAAILTPEQFFAALQQIAAGQMEPTAWNEFARSRCARPDLEQARAELVQLALWSGQCSARPISRSLQTRAQEFCELLQ